MAPSSTGAGGLLSPHLAPCLLSDSPSSLGLNPLDKVDRGPVIDSTVGVHLCSGATPLLGSSAVEVDCTASKDSNQSISEDRDPVIDCSASALSDCTRGDLDDCRKALISGPCLDLPLLENFWRIGAVLGWRPNIKAQENLLCCELRT